MIEIVSCREQDIPTLREIFLKVRKNTFTWMDTTAFSLNDFDKETDNEYILVALSNGTVIGFISLWLPDNFVHHLFIDEQHQKKGVGTKLLKAAIEKIKLPVRLKCFVKNESAVGFYKRKGFVNRETGQSENGPYILFELNKEIE